MMLNYITVFNKDMIISIGNKNTMTNRKKPEEKNKVLTFIIKI